MPADELLYLFLDGMSAIELVSFFLDAASTADFPPLMTGFGVSLLELEESKLEEFVAEAPSLDEEEASAELDALENESSATAQNVVALSALTQVPNVTEALNSTTGISLGIRTNVADDGGRKHGSNTWPLSDSRQQCIKPLPSRKMMPRFDSFRCTVWP